MRPDLAAIEICNAESLSQSEGLCIDTDYWKAADYLDLQLVPLLQLFHFSILISQLSLLVLQIFLGDLPEGIDFILQILQA